MKFGVGVMASIWQIQVQHELNAECIMGKLCEVIKKYHVVRTFWQMYACSQVCKILIQFARAPDRKLKPSVILDSSDHT